MAETIRYRRRVEKGGRIDQLDVRLALETREAWVFAGAVYERRLTEPQRQAVFAAKGTACLACGAPATDIDHIDGGGGDELDNLQPLCRTCHLEKSVLSLQPLSPDDPLYAVYQQRKGEYFTRVNARKPLRFCDDEEHWEGRWRALARARKRKDELEEWLDTV